MWLKFGKSNTSMNLAFLRVWLEKPLFWRVVQRGVVLVQARKFETGAKYDLKTLHQSGKRV